MTFEETRGNMTDTVRDGIRRSKPFMDNTPEPEGAPVGPSDAEIMRRAFAKHEDHKDTHANGSDPNDPQYDPIGDAETEYDIEYDDEPEDDGQPSEYEEWQDYMGGDDWDFGQCDEGGY
jgi:hypothetical protein